MSGTAIGEHAGSLQIPVPAFDAGTTGDTAISVPFGSYVVRRLTLYGASVSFAASTATVDLRTASGGGGSAIVSAAATTGLTTASVIVDPSLALTTAQTAGTLFLRVVQGVAPVSGTLKAVLEIQPLP